MGSIAGTSLGETGLRYVARQPILDMRGVVRGYELLFRDAPRYGFTGDGEHATRTMLDNLVLFDSGRFTGGRPAFINCTEETLTGGLVGVVPPEATVLEVLETVKPTPALVESCRELKAAGYRIALDDFEWSAGMDPLVALADYIKVDFLRSGPEERRDLVERLRGSRAVLLAEKIETQAHFEQAVRAGFSLFQGYYFCYPELVANRVVPANLSAQIELLQELQSKAIDFTEMARLVRRDPAIAYRLLRMANSAAFGIRREIRSVEMALIAVGESRFRKMAILAIAAGFCPKNKWEALRMALVRARFCELGAARAGYDQTEQYLLGLFSLLPAMMQISMEEAVARVCLREEVRCVLLGECNGVAWLLRWIESHEGGDWEACDRIVKRNALDVGELVRNLRDAVVWADGMLQPIG